MGFPLSVTLLAKFCIDTEDISVLLELYLFPYADDRIILAESHAELQAALHAVHQYCINWKLSISTEKTKW